VMQNQIAGSKHVNNPPILHSLESLPVITPFPVSAQIQQDLYFIK